jgi:DNA-binding CsgD family transcriptional regulator
VPEAELQLPAALNPWVAAMVVWPVVDAGAYRLVCRRYGAGRQPDWAFFVSLLSRSGIAEPAVDTDTYQIARGWLPTLEKMLDQLGGVDTVRVQLLEEWSADPDPALLSPISEWARRYARWDVLERVWLLLGENTSGLPARTLEVFRDLPAEARKVRPILTWASGAAASVLAPTEREVEAVWQRLLLDSAMLHADWSVRTDSDEAVSAGTFRMIGERRLPATRAGQSLDAAWRTKQEIDAFIDARSRAGNPPGRTSHGIFRAFSARLALFRFDPLSAIEEARWAGILADWEPVAAAARGVEALALSLSTEDGPHHHSAPPVASVDDDLGARGLRGQGQVLEILADGNEAARRLDREALDRCLALVSADTAALGGVWAVRTALEAWRAVLWGDVPRGLEQMSTSVQRLSRLGREQEEPLGRALLNRVRVLLLVKSGAFVAAIQRAESLPENISLLSRARVHLWAGEYKLALRLADAGPYQLGLGMIDRYRLTLIRVAAALLDGSMDDALRMDATREIGRLLESETFVNIALLPPPARAAVLDLCRSEFDPAEPRLLLLQERLAQLNDSADDASRPLRLTDRETLLLPMLATDDSVPEIARKLHVSVNTVRKQVVTLREKFEVKNRAELVRKARTRGAIP